MKHKTSRLLSILLCLVMLLGLLPVTVRAAGETTLYTCDFQEESSIEGWLFDDNDGDGYGWERMNGLYATAEDQANNYALASHSYKNDVGVLTPDNWAYTPDITLPGVQSSFLTYTVFAQDPKYYAEPYNVYVCEAGSDPALLLHETLQEGEDSETPATRTLDLSAYAGRTVRIAFRHHDVSDQFTLVLDDIRVWSIDPWKMAAAAVTVDEPAVGMPVSSYWEIPGDYGGYTVANVSWEPCDEVFQANQAYTVLVTLEAKKGHVFLEDVKAYINDQPAEIITQSLEELKIAYTFEALEPPMPSMFFEDVKPGNWFYEDVEFVYYNKLMVGVGKNRFEPNGKCTRAMIVTILYRMENEPGHSGANPFSDVPSGSWYTDAVIWAAEKGIVMGMGNGKFDPMGTITREQMATFLCRYASWKGFYQEDDCAMLAGFADCGSVASWAYDSVSWAVGVGLLRGVNQSDGLYLQPKGAATRCQVAALIHRFCDTFGE